MLIPILNKTQKSKVYSISPQTMLSHDFYPTILIRKSTDLIPKPHRSKNSRNMSSYHFNITPRIATLNICHKTTARIPKDHETQQNSWTPGINIYEPYLCSPSSIMRLAWKQCFWSYNMVLLALFTTELITHFVSNKYIDHLSIDLF